MILLVIILCLRFLISFRLFLMILRSSIHLNDIYVRISPEIFLHIIISLFIFHLKIIYSLISVEVVIPLFQLGSFLLTKLLFLS